MSLRLAFYGDDFTGSTDAMESLTLAGLKTRLFTAPPTSDQLDSLDAFGVAGTSRAMTPAQMDEHLPPIFAALRDSGAGIVHYKVCSTFDSSPTIGNIGRVIEIGASVFGKGCVPVLAAAPHLGRYCAFGNLFARLGSSGEIFRLDRHPSISRHPVTPMHEADLRRHLALQTSRSIGLVDVTQLDGELPDTDIAVLDLMDASQLPAVGRLISGTRFVVGSSGVSAALAAHWRLQPVTIPPAAAIDTPLLVVSGSCSPVTAGQIAAAREAGFADVPIGPDAVQQATDALADGRNVIVHSRNVQTDTNQIGHQLGDITRGIVERSSIQRCLIAGGDTSGTIATALDVKSLQMVATLVRGAPVCKADTGLELILKGGQIGPPELFIRAATRVAQKVTS
jgi:uncharacterized protein YgbK (DUF1537 family)